MLAFAVFGLAARLVLAQPAPAPTVDEIVARSIEARGGLAKLMAVQSEKMTGRITVGPDAEGSIVMEAKRPNKFRLDVTLQGKTMTQAYDGKKGWELNPFEGSETAELMGPDDQSDAAEQADMDGSLVDWKQKGHKVELAGREKVAGVDAWKLKVTLKNGSLRILYLDPDSYLAIKSATRRTIGGAETETVIGNYKEVSGILMPHSLEAGPTGSSERQKITLEKIEINVPIDDARFAIPAKQKAPEPDSGRARERIGFDLN